MTDPSSWTQLVGLVGFPAFFLLAFCFGLWKAATWLAVNLLVPLKDTHISFIQSTQETQEKQAVAQERQADAQEKQLDAQVKQTQAIENQTVLIRELRDAQNALCKYRIGFSNERATQ